MGKYYFGTDKLQQVIEAGNEGTLVPSARAISEEELFIVASSGTFAVVGEEAFSCLR